VDAQLTRMIEKLETRAPTDVEPLRRAAEDAGIDLPRDYVEFMAASNGASGDVGSSWIELWPVDEILDAAEGESPYDGVFLFAGDGANTIYGFDAGANSEIVEGDWIGLSRDRLIRHGQSFGEFLKRLASV
jgi:SMI1 / KNR4 family (SUKH-1)